VDEAGDVEVENIERTLKGGLDNEGVLRRRFCIQVLFLNSAVNDSACCLSRLWVGECIGSAHEYSEWVLIEHQIEVSHRPLCLVCHLNLKFQLIVLPVKGCPHLYPRLLVLACLCGRKHLRKLWLREAKGVPSLLLGRLVESSCPIAPIVVSLLFIIFIGEPSEQVCAWLLLLSWGFSEINSS